MSESADVVGLVLHFRTPERTLACLASLHDEGIRHVVMVDNSQDDGCSIATMALGLDRLRNLGLHIDVLQSMRNLGFASGVNFGLAYIRAEGAYHVLLINSDATLISGSLTAMVSMLHTAGMVAPGFFDGALNERRAPIVFYQPHFALYQRHSRYGSIGYPSGCCLLIRKDQASADLFDSDFFFYGEDVMLGHTYRQRSMNVAECAGATVIHTGTVSAKNGSRFYEYHMVRAHWLLARKLARSRHQMILFVMARCITLPIRALVRSIRWRSLLPWLCLWMASVDVLNDRCCDLTPAATRDLLESDV